MPSLELIVVDLKGRELDPMMEQASHQFLLDDKFSILEPSTNLHGGKT